jgi:hypothetical protein
MRWVGHTAGILEMNIYSVLIWKHAGKVSYCALHVGRKIAEMARDKD